jgi:hypothetical protein
MRVVCIKDFKSSSLQYELTYGKVYQCESKPNWSGTTWTDLAGALSDDCYFIRCDKGYISPYNKRSFITLEEWREKELNKILSE